MDIEELSQRLDDDSEAYILEIRHAETVVVFIVRMDCWIETGRQRTFEIRAHDVVEVRPEMGWCGALELTGSHPLIWDHTSPWLDLYYASAPDSAGEVIARLYESHQSIFQDWRPLSQYLNATLAQLQKGNGLLASGPKPLIHEYHKSLEGLLRLNVVPCHRVPKVAKAMILGDSFTICSYVTVAEIPDIQA